MLLLFFDLWLVCISDTLGGTWNWLRLSWRKRYVWPFFSQHHWWRSRLARCAYFGLHGLLVHPSKPLDRDWQIQRRARKRNTTYEVRNRRGAKSQMVVPFTRFSGHNWDNYGLSSSIDSTTDTSEAFRQSPKKGAKIAPTPVLCNLHYQVRHPAKLCK